MRADSYSLITAIDAFVLTNAAASRRQPPIQNACYGASKASLNWYGVRINAEDDWLNAFVFNPGFSTTDMGVAAARAYGFTEDALLTPGEALDGMFRVLQTTTKEEHGGKLVRYTGEVDDW
ncbi:hypothetical protein IMZ48_23275 [Candidatus Bathyarchaeota archaeon]|nr:hypothetical protein [Candidatus Bathyarchaeota archaeon]